jgi:hypothetical protein
MISYQFILHFGCASHRPKINNVPHFELNGSNAISSVKGVTERHRLIVTVRLF